jgi:hypothetical protein
MIGQNRTPVTKRAHYNGVRYWPFNQSLAQASTGKTKSDVRRAKSQERRSRAKSDENEQKRRCQAKIFSFFLIIFFTSLKGTFNSSKNLFNFTGGINPFFKRR